MGMINSIQIENFRSISSLKYNPRQINLIIGRNNSGKTSLMAAISAVMTGKFNYSDFNSSVMLQVDNENMFRIFDIKMGEDKAIISSNNHTVMLYKFGSTMPDNIRMAYNSRVYYALLEIYNNLHLPKELFESVRDFIQTKIPVSVSTFDDEFIFSIDPENSLKQDSGLSMEFIRILSGEKDNVDLESSEMSATLNNQIAETLVHQLKESINKEKLAKSEKVIKIINSEFFMSKVFKDEVRIIKLESILKEYEIIPNLERLTATGVVYKNNNGTLSQIPYNLHGDGFFTLLRFLYVIQEAKDGILLIEEPENHMHPGYIRIFVEQLLDFSKKLNVQVFLTTHSSDLINEFAHYPETEEETELMQISSIVRRKEGTDLYNYSIKEAQKTLDSLLIDLRGT